MGDDLPLVLGDWSQFIITDRVGSTVELVPHVFGNNHRPEPVSVASSLGSVPVRMCWWTTLSGCWR